MLISFVIEALEYGQKFKQQDLHAQEIGIAALTSLTLNMNLSKDAKRSSPYDFCNFAQGESFDLESANTFFSLTEERKLEEWVVIKAPVDGLRKVFMPGGNTSKIRCLISEAIAIISPRIRGKVITSKLVIFEDFYRWGSNEFVDIDSGQKYEIFVPPYESKDNFSRDWEGQIRG